MRATRTSTHPISAIGACAALALAAGATAAPAAAQPYPGEEPAYVGEVVVTGMIRPSGPTRLTQTIGIRDLDLANPQDRRVLRLRIHDTAHELCDALGEGNSAPGPLLPSCVDQAVRDVRPQVRLAIAQAYDRDTYASLEASDPYAPRP